MCNRKEGDNADIAFWFGSAVGAIVVAFVLIFVVHGVMGVGDNSYGHHRGYLDGRVSMTRCAHGAAKVVDDKVACVEVRP